MLHSVTVTNPAGDSLKMELSNPIKSGFIITSIDGMGASQANIHITELATGDGGIYNSARLNTRNIVLNLLFMDDPSVGRSIEDARHLSYKYFPIKKWVSLEFDTDRRRAIAYGYVESNDPNVFSSQSGTQISIICPDPYFYSTNPTETIFSGLESLFEFPFSNESLTEKTLIMGEIWESRRKTIYYEGDADVGFVITIHATGTVENPVITKTETRESITINTDKMQEILGFGIIAGDDIIISTVRGAKYVHHVRNAVVTNIIHTMARNLTWIQLTPGNNTFLYEADLGESNMEFKIRHHVLYEGV